GFHLVRVKAQMDPTTLKNDKFDHSGVSQCFPDRIVLGPVPIPVMDMVSLETSGVVVSGSKHSINKVKDHTATPDLVGLGNAHERALEIDAGVAE
ncbi:hypothetical protein PanWU01x14_234170, partial [Parasponia andersonii]